jgi:hypothetical protein
MHSSVLLQLATRTTILENYFLRRFVLSLAGVSRDVSRFDYEEQFLHLYKMITSLKPCEEKLISISRLAELAWRCIIDCKIGVEFPFFQGFKNSVSVSRTTRDLGRCGSHSC